MLAIGKYHTPVVTKYKVRYILFRLLDFSDFKNMIGHPTAPQIDIARALDYYRANKSAIQSRLQILKTVDDIQRELLNGKDFPVK